MEFTDMEDLIESEEPERERFVIDDDSKAEWAVRKIREAMEDTKNWKTYYEEQLEKIESRNNSTIEYLRSLLYAYFQSVPHKVTKTQQKYTLPSCDLIVKHQEPEMVRDAKKLIDWLLCNGGSAMIRIKQEVAWDDLKKQITVSGKDAFLTETGEKIDGITVNEREDKFVVDLKGEKK